MLVFYARTSTEDQDYGLEGQIDELNRHAEYEKQKFKLFSEQVSSVSTDRPQLEAALEWCREGDILVVTKLDRLARSLRSLFKIQDRLAEKKVGLRILGANGMDTTSPNGKLFINFMGALAEWERDMMLQRQRIGIDKARAEGKYKGMKPTAIVKADEIKARRAAG